MKKIFAIIISLMIAASAIALSACASSAQTAESKMAYAETAAATEEYIASTYDLAQVPEEAAGAFSSPDYGMYNEAGFSDGANAGNVANPNRKLIREVNLSLETKEYDSLTAAITDRINMAGGYIENSSSSNPSINSDYGYQQSRHMNITARIPSDELDDFVNGVSTLGNLTYKSENVTDVTLQYTDTESRKKSLLTEQARLDELMKKAETVEDLIAIEQRQSQVRYELESIESQLRTYDNQVDYSTVYISIDEVVNYTPQKEASLWERISEGFTSCIRGLGNFFEGLFVVVIAYSPLIILIVAVVVAIVLIVKHHKKKKAAKKAEENQEKKEQSETPEKPEQEK